MRPADFAYDLPAASIAQVPLGDRPSARLLVDLGDGIRHLTVRDLPELVRPGDVIVLNDTKVLPARLRLAKESGGAVEVLLLERVGGTGTCETWEALVRPGRRVAPGTVLRPGPDLAATVWSCWFFGYRQGITGTTPGKRQQGLRLVDAETVRPPGGARGVGRWLVPGLINTVVGVYSIIDYLWPLWDVRNQRVTDKMFRTLVVGD